MNAIPSPVVHRSRDEGSVLPMILALMVVGSLGVVALLTFATTLFTNRPPIEVRDRTFWTAKSAMSMAMTLQREHGPDGCYEATDTVSMNGFTANITCTPTGNYFGTGRGRFAVVTTGNQPDVVSLAGRGAAAVPKPITGNVLVNGGRFGELTADIAPSSGVDGVVSNVAMSNATTVASPVARYFDPSIVDPDPQVPTDCGNPAVATSMAFPNPGTHWSTICQSLPWWEFAGDLNDVGTYDYPELPPLPAYLRPSVAQATIGSCNVYFPGRYETPLTLGAGRHYFPSGVYYFENVLTLSPGAELVAGQGRWDGCTFDAEAAFAPTAPNFHAITGRGATLLFGGSGRLVANDASIQINRRVSDSTSRGTETVAIRSVNFRTAAHAGPADAEVPDDVVYLADVYDAANSACNASLSTATCLQRAADHSVRLSPTTPVARYRASTLAPTDTIVSITQTGGTASTNQFVTDGYVFVPNSRVLLTGGGNTDYRLRLSAGVVASSLELGYDAMPSSPSNWFLGVLDEPIQRQVDLFVSVTAPNGQRTVSRAIMEVNIDESYAINGWTVDPNAGVVTTTPPAVTTTTIPETTTTTTVPETTTTTTVPETTTTTTLPACPAADPSWRGEYWEDANPDDPFDGSATLTRQDSSIDFDWGSGGPGGEVGNDEFSARWTRKVNFAEAGTYRFTMRGDDGMRLFVDGARVSPENAWRDQAVTTYTFDVPLGVCHDLRFEYYENTGQAVARLSWVRVGP
jgi:hypothetical protein